MGSVVLASSFWSRAGSDADVSTWPLRRTAESRGLPQPWRMVAVMCRARQNVRVYRCGDRWHLTSVPAQMDAVVRDRDHRTEAR